LRSAEKKIGQAATARFDNNRSSDRNFFLIYVGLIWLGVCAGFVPQIIKHIQTHTPAYPLIAHFHAPVFVSWLCLLTVHVLLIRAHRPDLHRRLGAVGAVLAGLMVVLGPTTALIVDSGKFGTPGSDPSFLSVQLTDVVAFAGLVAAAIYCRNDAAAHKRLMLLSTL
jgi:hypothetical protein